MGDNTNAKVSLEGFLLGLGVLVIYLFSFLGQSFETIVIQNWIYIVVVCSLIVVICVAILFRGYEFQVAIRACGLGLLIVSGLSLAFSSWTCHLLGWYLVVLGIFHWSEYYATAVTNPKNLSLSSYLLDHSLAYHIAVISGFIEFLLEWYFLPDWKQPNFMSIVGLLLVSGGEVVRKLAMWTAGSNFNHYIRYYREQGHQLVTNGIYKYFRHPSYVGWFYWSVGTQLMLLNPVCMVLYAMVSWKFFEERIRVEEKTLLSFFGETYVEYQRRVGTGLPFIRGCHTDL